VEIGPPPQNIEKENKEGDRLKSTRYQVISKRKGYGRNSAGGNVQLIPIAQLDAQGLTSPVSSYLRLRVYVANTPRKLA
jgi:hypothetical protein